MLKYSNTFLVLLLFKVAFQLNQFFFFLTCSLIEAIKGFPGGSGKESTCQCRIHKT